MSNWEEAEFEIQQEAVREWAKKKTTKILNGWWFRRKMKKLAQLQTIVTGKKVTVGIEIYEVNWDGQNNSGID